MGVLFSATRDIRPSTDSQAHITTMTNASHDNRHSQAASDKAHNFKTPESQHEQLDGPKENARYVLIRQHDTFMEYVNTPEESPLLALARPIEKEVGNNKDMDTSELFSKPLTKKLWEDCRKRQTAVIVDLREAPVLADSGDK